MSQSLGEILAALEPRETVVLEGIGSTGPVQWHVNKNIKISSGASSPRHSIILQKADASEHWVVAILDETDDGWVFDTLTSFEGNPPPSKDMSSHGESLSPDEVTVVTSTDE